LFGGIVLSLKPKTNLLLPLKDQLSYLRNPHMDYSQTFEILGLVLLLGLCVYYFIYNPLKKILEGLKIKMNGRQTYGKIVENVYKEGAEGEWYYHPVIHFTTLEGDLVEYESEIGRDERYRIGKQLTIYYMPDEPTKVYIANYSVLFYIFFLLTGIAATPLISIQILKMI
jgi:hypothetical protein